MKTTFAQFLQNDSEEENKVPSLLKKQAGPPLGALDKLKNKVKLKLGHKPMFLKKQAESAGD